MAHIWSSDVLFGSTFDGLWQMSSTISGPYTLQWHLVRDEADIPWLFAGVDTLHIENGVTTVLVTFGTVATDKTDPATVVTLFDTIEAAIILAGNPFVLMSVTYVSATDRFELLFNDAAVFIDWDVSTSSGLFGSTGQTTPGTLQILPAANAESRPDVLDVFCPSVTTPHIASRTPEVSFAVNLQDGFSTATVSFIPSNALSIRWSQLYAPGVACPMTNRWHLIFDKKLQ